MTCKLAIGNDASSMHEAIVNVQQAGAQTQWVIKPGQVTAIEIQGPNMDIVCALGKFVGNVLTGPAATRALPYDRVVDGSAAEVIKGQRLIGRFSEENNDW
jgi:hypothetical protein